MKSNRAEQLASMLSIFWRSGRKSFVELTLGEAARAGVNRAGVQALKEDGLIIGSKAGQVDTIKITTKGAKAYHKHFGSGAS